MTKQIEDYPELKEWTQRDESKLAMIEAILIEQHNIIKARDRR